MAANGEGLSGMEERERATEETSRDSAAQLSVELLQTELSKIARKWYEFGQKMGLRSSQLHSIETEKGQDAEYYFKELLSVIVDDGSEVEVTWGSLVRAVSDIGEGELGRELAEKYGVSMEENEEGGGDKGGEGEGESVPDMKVQKEEIRTLLNQKLQKGDTWCLVDVRWLKQWKKYVGFDQWDQVSSGQQAYFPGPVDTSNLFLGTVDEGVLKEHLMEELDYSLVPEPAWVKLVAWYGISETSRPVARKVVEYGLYMKHSKVEVYLLSFKLSIHPKLTEHVTKSFSRADTVADLEKELRRTFSISEETVCRVWHRYMSHTYELLNEPTQSLQDAGLYNMQTIVLECQREDGTWPRSTREAQFQTNHSTRSTDSITGTSYSSSSGSSSSYRSGGGSSNWSSFSHQPSHPGLCGLSNLGNTCFMNSALQCLSNTELLTEYFTSDAYKKHINKTNPLGMRGQVAETYGALLDDMWSGKCSTCSPRQFKTVVGRFAPQFSGYQQQDSHELLAFLMDGLHEDLNLVVKKPYVDMSIETKDRDEKDVAEESWYKYLQRNQSVVVKVFQGQLKSTLICPQCCKLSKTFDPFMYLSLPLPVKKTRRIEVVMVFADSSKGLAKYTAVVPKRGSISHLKTDLSQQTQIPEDMMVVVDVYNSRFHRIYDNKETVTQILDRDDIFVYELQHSVGDEKWVLVPIYHREYIVKKVNYGYSYTQRYHSLFGLPNIIRVPRTTSTYDTVYQAVLERCSRYVCSPEEAERRLFESEREKKDEEKEVEGEGEGEREGEGDGEPMEEEQGTLDTHNNNNDNENGEREDQEIEEETDDPNIKKTADPVATDNGEAPPTNKPAPPTTTFRMFKLVVVNSYGTQDIRELASDGSTLRLTSQTYVACDWSTEAKDKCYDLDKAFEKEDRTQKEAQEAPKEITLYNCLDLFTEKEKLGKDDEWYCPECKEMVQATKQFDLWVLPRVLVIHLKRFSYNRYWRDKLDTFIEFPVSGLDLRKYVKAPDQPESVYDLFAISNHFGGMGGGHYTAYCKNKTTGKWYNFDDSHVSEASEDRIVSSSAYLLFYCRRDEGKVVHPPLSRTLSQTFREEVKQRKKRYNPSETSHDEEPMVQGEGEGEGEPHPPNDSNNVCNNDDDAFNQPSSMNEPD